MDLLKKKVLIHSGILFFLILVEFFSYNLFVIMIAGLINIYLSIKIFIYCIKIIKNEDYLFGISFLVFSGLYLLVVLLSFIVGFIFGYIGVI